MGMAIKRPINGTPFTQRTRPLKDMFVCYSLRDVAARSNMPGSKLSSLVVMPEQFLRCYPREALYSKFEAGNPKLAASVWIMKLCSIRKVGGGSKRGTACIGEHLSKNWRSLVPVAQVQKSGSDKRRCSQRDRERRSRGFGEMTSTEKIITTRNFVVRAAPALAQPA